MSKPKKAAEAVLVQSLPMEEGTPICKGYDFNKGVDYSELMKSYVTTGFQATNLGLAIEEINKMINWDGKMDNNDNEEEELPLFTEQPTGVKDEEKIQRPIKTTIFLGYTSNMISSGIRETIKFLVQHNLVSCIVTTAGGIEEDFLKCLAPHYMGDFSLDGKKLRKKGHNRIGNLIVPNINYCKFEDWMRPILDKMVEEQNDDNINWTPSKIIDRLGKEIDNEESVYYWAHKNKIPVYCPAITDGSIGDMMYFHAFNLPEEERLRVDLVGDIVGINSLAMNADKTGMIILGGGVIKHHICNANLMRNGADYTVFINTGQEFDGSDSGARPDEAVSWGKIRLGAKSVKVYTDATLVFPIVVAETFAKFVFQKLIPKQQEKEEQQQENNNQ
eukprot:TRINITY_DN4156_c0_g1_i1.p1 TRINITY_DN4156_c0_g1~~TRINITY_DN4156_c0_g1_i1.p1  ORF type:complete len:389 (-),score=156.29 TRINITY_DN4156_c0_g1_i1:96-1262(-)